MATTVQQIEEKSYGVQPASGQRLPVATRVGRVRLAVSRLERSLEFYTQVIGLAQLGAIEAGQTPGSRLARLTAQGGGPVLVELEEVAGVEPIGRRSRLGLYHTAVLLPSREALSSFVRHLAQMGVNFGAGDHIYSEALYLTDPDGLTVEVYADRPRSEWVYEQTGGEGGPVEIVSATNPVRFAELPEVAEDSWKGAPEGTTIGHVHLYVGELQEAAEFYHQTLGFDVVTWRYPGALFISAGGYHHHVGLNVWAAGSPVAAATDARLLFWELAFPDEAGRDAAAERLRRAGYRSVETPAGAGFVDPWGITVALVVRA